MRLAGAGVGDSGWVVGMTVGVGGRGVAVALGIGVGGGVGVGVEVTVAVGVERRGVGVDDDAGTRTGCVAEAGDTVPVVRTVGTGVDVWVTRVSEGDSSLSGDGDASTDRPISSAVSLPPLLRSLP